jgi:hypothetical protein
MEEDTAIRDAMRLIFLDFQDRLPPRPRWYKIVNGRVVPMLGRDISSKMAGILSDHILRAKIKKDEKIFDASLLAGYLSEEFQNHYLINAEELGDSIIVTVR